MKYMDLIKMFVMMGMRCKIRMNWYKINLNCYIKFYVERF